MGLGAGVKEFFKEQFGDCFISDDDIEKLTSSRPTGILVDGLVLLHSFVPMHEDMALCPSGTQLLNFFANKILSFIPCPENHMNICVCFDVTGAIPRCKFLELAERNARAKEDPVESTPADFDNDRLPLPFDAALRDRSARMKIVWYLSKKLCDAFAESRPLAKLVIYGGLPMVPGQNDVSEVLFAHNGFSGPIRVKGLKVLGEADTSLFHVRRVLMPHLPAIIVSCDTDLVAIGALQRDAIKEKTYIRLVVTGGPHAPQTVEASQLAKRAEDIHDLTPRDFFAALMFRGCDYSDNVALGLTFENLFANSKFKRGFSRTAEGIETQMRAIQPLCRAPRKGSKRARVELDLGGEARRISWALGYWSSAPERGFTESAENMSIGWGNVGRGLGPPGAGEGAPVLR
jgi:hypothetical protein